MNQNMLREEDEPEGVKSLKIGRSRMSRDNGIEKVRRRCSRGGTTAVEKRGKTFVGNRPKGTLGSRKDGTVS